MKLNVKTIHYHGRTDKITTQTEWHVTGDIDGDPVAFRYLDVGNNAEYDTEAGLSMTMEKQRKYGRALLDWIERDESVLMDLKPGSSVELRKPSSSGPESKRNPGRFKP
ncbi:MAG: hypothetical protein K8R48_07450 [Alphaproteobacteria bacterium]|nr:hypothetical protein [Alphaproteobacteria bacterium]